MNLYDKAVLQGMDEMLIEAQRRSTFAALDASIGVLTGAPSVPEWHVGYMHGVALGARMRLARATQTVALRDEARGASV